MPHFEDIFLIFFIFLISLGKYCKILHAQIWQSNDCERTSLDLNSVELGRELIIDHEDVILLCNERINVTLIT